MSEIQFPSFDETEKALLGCALRDPSAAAMVASSLSDFDFTIKANALVFDSIKRLYERKSVVDAATVCADMKASKTFDDAGGMDYITEVVMNCIGEDNAPSYLTQLKNQATERNFLKKCSDVISLYRNDPSRDPIEFVSMAKIQIDDAACRGGIDGFQLSPEVVKYTLAQIEAERASGRKGLTGVDTGYPDPNSLTHGFQPGDLIVVAGRPSMGKTALAANFAYNATKDGKTVAFFSIEMKSDLIMKRLLSMVSQVDQERISGGYVNGPEFEKVIQASKEISSRSLCFKDNGSGTIGEVISDANRLKVVMGNLSLVVIDYLGLLTLGTKTENRQVEVAKMTRSLKLMARSLNVPVIIVVQLNRSTEDNEGSVPNLSNLRESGAIEQDADVVILLHRPEYYKPKVKGDFDDPVSVADVIVAKNRNGRVGTMNLTYDRAKSRFDSVTEDFKQKLRDQNSRVKAATYKKSGNGIDLSGDDA